MEKKKRIALSHDQYFKVRSVIDDDFNGQSYTNISTSDMAEHYQELLGFPIVAANIKGILKDLGIRAGRQAAASTKDLTRRVEILEKHVTRLLERI